MQMYSKILPAGQNATCMLHTQHTLLDECLVVKLFKMKDSVVIMSF